MASSNLKLKYGFGLSSVQIINKPGKAIVAAYRHLLGFISLQNTIDDHHDFTKDFSHKFQIIYQSHSPINNIILSDDHHLIAIQLQKDKKMMVRLS